MWVIILLVSCFCFPPNRNLNSNIIIIFTQILWSTFLLHSVGKYLKNFCTKDKPTVCSSCEEGHYSTQYSAFDRCEKCQQCHQSKNLYTQFKMFTCSDIIIHIWNRLCKIRTCACRCVVWILVCSPDYTQKCTPTTNANCSCQHGFLCSTSSCSHCVENKCSAGEKLMRTQRQTGI